MACLTSALRQHGPAAFDRDDRAGGIREAGRIDGTIVANPRN
jgi:hypothetical protein